MLNFTYFLKTLPLERRNFHRIGVIKEQKLNFKLKIMSTVKTLKSLALGVALLAGTTVFAQVPQEQPMQQEQEGQESDIDVDDAELEEFAEVAQKVMQKNQEMQQEMVGIIEDKGLTAERYQEIAMAESSGQDSDASDDEIKKKEEVDQELEEMQPKMEEEQTSIVEDSGLSMDRYEEIANALQNDQNLQQKLQQLMMENE